MVRTCLVNRVHYTHLQKPTEIAIKATEKVRTNVILISTWHVINPLFPYNDTFHISIFLYIRKYIVKPNV